MARYKEKYGAKYEAKILNGLLDSYENSLLSRRENKVKIHISFPFTEKTMPEYFDESSLAYEEIHSAVRELEAKGFLTVIWNKGKVGHIIQKLLLNEEHADQVYAYLKRKPKSDSVEEHLKLLEAWEGKSRENSVVQRFARYLMQRLKEGKSVKEYVELSDLKKTERLLLAISFVEENEESCYIREFSIRHFGDSKVFESMLGLMGKVLRRFCPELGEMDIYTVLAEYGIYHTPDYVYFKGEGEILLEGKQGTVLDLSSFQQGIGISGSDIKRIKISAKEKIRKVITIENLTTFFRWKEENSLIIYLGGYHNSVRRELLSMLYGEIPDAQFLHFGDIDVGGFEIYRDLREKTGIPFQTYHMGTEELQLYENCLKKLTDNDKVRLKRLIEKWEPGDKKNLETLRFMEQNQVKMEQEAIRNRDG